MCVIYEEGIFLRERKLREHYAAVTYSKNLLFITHMPYYLSYCNWLLLWISIHINYNVCLTIQVNDAVNAKSWV